MSQLITVENQSTALTAKQLRDLVWALNYQALYQYNRAPWVERGLAAAIESVQLLPKGAKPPAGAWNIILLDTIEEAGALGYHEDEAGTKIPVAYVGVKTSRQDGVNPAEVASHEMLEMIVDPNVASDAEVRKVLNHTAKEWYIVEVGDPCQGRGYDVGAPEGRPTGVIVADFAYPAWWALDQTRPFTSFAEECKLAPRLEPFEIAPEGYMSVAPENEPNNWSQIYGSDRPKAEAKEHAYEHPGDLS